MSTINRKIIAKIKALHAKTVHAGATEAEAVSAAEVAQKLMDEYRIDADSIAAAAYDRNILRLKGVNLNASKSHPFVFVGPGVQHLTGCRIYLSASGMIVVGDDVGRAMAEYLFDMCRNVMDAAWGRERESRYRRAEQAWSRHAPQASFAVAA